ncbi:MAG: LysM peptidoglycan-binding domain-containing protein [Pseudomonadota bacterium]
MIRTLWLCVCLAVGLGLVSSPALVRAQEPTFLTYRVQEGDTLLQIARDYMRQTSDWPQIQRLNQIKDPRQIPVDTQLRMPRRLLRWDPVIFEVAYFSGAVEIAGQQAKQGDRLSEGQGIVTRAGAYVTFAGRVVGGYGGRVSLPSNTKARLIQARRYALGDTLFVNFGLDDGRASVFSPSLEGEDELLLTTPRAVTAVRGTEFRAVFEPGADRAVTEVTEGVVALVSEDQEIAAAQGFGVATQEGGFAEPEALLPTPKLVDAGVIQMDETLSFQLETDAKAAAYRFQLSRDADFLDIIAGQVVAEGNAVFDGLPNGRYYVRARAISPNGIEGFADNVTGFRRKRLGVSAEAGPAAGVDGYLFKWLSVGDANARFAFQLWQGEDRSAMIVNETGLTTPAVTLTDLAPGAYRWRVAVVVPDAEEGLLKVWGPAKKLTIAE